MEQEENLIEGWCSSCTCKNRYHIGDNNGICVTCKCLELEQNEDSDLLDLLKPFILRDDNTPYIESEEQLLNYTEEVEQEEPPLSITYSKVTFLGKASRECESCGDIKLYKDFNNSNDPSTLCNYCAWEAAEFALLEDMGDTQRWELEEIEDRILENEMAYEEAIERQEMIDSVLRQLDE